MTPTPQPDPAGALQGAWRLDHSTASVTFQVRHLFGLATVRGRFARFEGSLDLAAQPPIRLDVDASSVESGNPKRDGALRSPAFLDVENHPRIIFAADEALPDDEGLAVRGRLSAIGSEMDLELRLALRPFGLTLEAEAATDLDQRELGIFGKFGSLRSPTRLLVSGTLLKAAGGSADLAGGPPIHHERPE